MSERLTCLKCGAQNKVGDIFCIHGVYLWANQHGYKKRYFCHRCGCVWEVVDMPDYGSEKIVGNWATIVINIPFVQG